MFLKNNPYFKYVIMILKIEIIVYANVPNQIRQRRYLYAYNKLVYCETYSCH